MSEGATTPRERDVSVLPAALGTIGSQVLWEGDSYRVIGEQLADVVIDRAARCATCNLTRRARAARQRAPRPHRALAGARP